MRKQCTDDGAATGIAADEMSGSSAKWPAGTGEMVELVRRHDWSSTRLGPLESWSAELKAVVNLTLSSPIVSSVTLTEDRLLIYNDSAAKLYGNRHPGALGRSLRETFPDSYPSVASLYDLVYRGESVTVTAQPLAVGTSVGNEIFDAYLSPVWGTNGAVFGVHMMGLEVGDRVRIEAALRESEGRQAYLLELSDALRPLTDPERIQDEAMRLLGRRLGVSRAQYYIADETGEYLSSSGGYTNGVPAAVGRFKLIEFGKYAFDGFHAGKTQVVSDATTDPRISETVLNSYKAVGFLAYIGVPFVQRGRLLGTVAVHQANPRQWTDSERMMVEETAERAGIATERARAELALRESEERQAFLLKFSDVLRPLTDGIEVQRETTRLLGEHLGVDRCYYFETDHQAGEYIIYRDFRRGNLRSLAGRHPIQQWPEMTAALSRGEMLVVHDYANSAYIPPEERRPTENLDIRAIILVPLVKGGSLVACMAVIQSVPRNWKDIEVSTVVDVAERTWAAVESARAEKARRESEERFQQFAKASAAGLWIAHAETLAMEFVSPSIGMIYGVEPNALVGDLQHWASLIIPEERNVARLHLEEARKGESVVHEFRIQRPSDGAFRWIRNTVFPLHDDEQIARIGGIAEDITEAKLAVEHQSVLLAELQHRVRNIMAIIRSITARTGERAESVQEYASIMSGRLLALARVQALLTRAANADVNLAAIVRDEVSVQAQHEGQYELIGPDVPLSPKAAEVLTIAVHELATNALKYGALSVPHGKVIVEWKTFEKQDVTWLSFDWKEEGSPARPHSTSAVPRRRGFGSELIEGRIPYELRGKGRISIEPGGAQCHLEFPLREGHSVLETGAPQRATVFGGAIDMTGEPDLKGCRVLVIEDEYFLATDIARALRGAGAEVAGPSPSEEAAKGELEVDRPTAVVLDINLGLGPSFKLAEKLKDQGIPFVFLTGYDVKIIPEEFRSVECLQKPIELRKVVSAISRILTPAT